jgi:hypothetical protein
MPYDDLLIEINNALEENIVLTENTEKISEYPGERIIATYVLSHICKCWSFHLVKSWGNN